MPTSARCHRTATAACALGLAAAMFLLALANARGVCASPPETSSPSSAPTPAAPRVDEAVLYRIPGGLKVADAIASPDARHVACAQERSTADKAVFDISVDGIDGPQYPWIVRRSLLFSPDSGRICYQVQQDGPISLVIERIDRRIAPTAAPGAESLHVGKGYWMAGHVLFSHDGLHTAFPAQAQKQGSWFMVCDDKEAGPYDALDDTEMLFSPDASRFAYRATRAGRQFIVVDGAPGPGVDSVHEPLFSAHGNRFGYRAVQGGDSFYMIDGRAGPRFDAVVDLIFSDDGRRYAYAANSAAVGGKQMLIVDGKAYKPFDSLSDIAFSPDGRRVATCARTGDKSAAVIDGKESTPYDGTGALHFSPDSQRLAFIAGKGKRLMVVVDGQEEPEFDGVGAIAFSPDSKHLAYLASEQKSRYLVLDGQKVGPAGQFAFSPDGNHVARTVPRPDGRWGLAVDSTELEPTYDGFPLGSRIVFESPTLAITIAGRNSEMLRVEIRVP